VEKTIVNEEITVRHIINIDDCRSKIQDIKEYLNAWFYDNVVERENLDGNSVQLIEVSIDYPVLDNTCGAYFKYVTFERNIK
jgi:hypothetical protein